VLKGLCFNALISVDRSE